MNVLIRVVFVLVASLCALRASELQVRLFSLKGELPSFEQLERLVEERKLTSVREWVIPVAADGTISLDETESESVATEFDELGNAIKSSAQPVGIAISGKLGSRGNLDSLEVSDTMKLGDEIYGSENGVVVVRPIFSSYRLQLEDVSLPLKAWTYHGGIVAPDGFKKLIAIRMMQDAVEHK